jgi:hypothetical protein
MHLHGDAINERSTLRIVHALPGRLRFRGLARAGGEDLAEAIGGLAGVRGCSWSPRTGSILVLFEPETIAAEAIIQAVARQAGIDESLVADLAHERPTGVRQGQVTFAAGVHETFGELDRRVHRITRGVAGLGALLPLVLTVWAAREIVLGRTAPLAWSTALWYAHGLFRDYNSPPSG